MKTCAYCMKEDLHDNARKCHHCGAWLGKTGFFRNVAVIVGLVFLLIFVLGLASCGLMALI
jgi:hypothetical protein